jgi:hypothetical protein
MELDKPSYGLRSINLPTALSVTSKSPNPPHIGLPLTFIFNTKFLFYL